MGEFTNNDNFTNTTDNFRLYENWKTTMKKRNNLSGQAWNNAESS